jgi:Tol biopolymer transport system component
MLQERQISAQLQRILQSPAFRNSARSSQFLRFCVERTLTGRAGELKETTIAVALFQRATDYDPKRDPIVRVHAMRVREKLSNYYGSDGSSDKIRIELPKGGYVPQISDASQISSARLAAPEIVEKADASAPLIKVCEAETDKQPDSSSSPALPVTTRGHGANRFLWLTLSAILLCVALTYPLWRRSSPAIPSGEMVPIDGAPAVVREPAWSPDGNFLAYAAQERPDEPMHIYIQDVRHGGAAHRLTAENSEESRPVWSPNGREVAFARMVSLSRFDIVRTTTGRQDLHIVTQVRLFGHIIDLHPALDWSPDGKFLLTCEQSSPLTPVRLVVISLATGDKRLLTSPPSLSSGDLDAKFSPDGKTIAFQRGGLGDLYTVSLEGEGAVPVKQLTFDNPGVRGIAWTDGGRSILYGSQPDLSPAYRIWKIAAEGGHPQPVTPQGFDSSMPSFSTRQGLALLHGQSATEMVEQSLTNASPSRPLLSSEAGAEWPRYSPDGNSIAFVSSRSGTQELWLVRTENAEPRQLTHFNGTGRVFWASWSPDGQSIVFPFRRDGATVLYTYSLQTGTLRQLTHTVHRHFSPVYSGDGRYIYYSSNDDGTPRIWRIRADGSAGAEALFWDGLMQFTVSPDDKWFYSVMEQPGNIEIVRRNIKTGESEAFVTLPGQLASLNDLTIDGNTLFLATRERAGTKANLELVDLKTRKITKGAEIELSMWPEPTTFSISPKRQLLIVAHPKMSKTLLYQWLERSGSVK